MKLNRWTKLLCIVLAVMLITRCAVWPAKASEAVTSPVSSEPVQTQPQEDSLMMLSEDAPTEVTEAAETTAPVQETLAEEAAQETVPAAETVQELPEQTVPAEVPAETSPALQPTEAPRGMDLYLQIPLYFQTDYPDNMYGTGSIASSGCSVTCLAMVATYMTGHEYLPDELARYFGGTAENNIDRLRNGSDAMQLAYREAANWHETYQALLDGKVVIALMDGTSLFTDSQHFIVLAGITEEGKIMVNDPYEPNYDAWNLKRAFREGFTENDILMGYSGGWIYDKSAMPEDPFLYYEPEPVRGECRYPDIHLTDEDKDLLARMIWTEAQGESLEGQQAVAEVVLNRMASDLYPDTLRGVIFADGQFKSATQLDDAKPYQAQYEMIENALYGPYVLPKEVVFFATYPVNDFEWGRIGGHVFCYIWGYQPEE